MRASLLVYLGEDAEFPDVHPEQVDALARRRDLPALLDRHVPLGPDQAARRLGVRRVDWDQVVRLGYVAAVGSVEVDYKRQGGLTTVPLFSAVDVAFLDVVRPEVDWRAVRETLPGRRSPLAALTPLVPGADRVALAQVAGVGRATVAGWRRRADFSGRIDGSGRHPEFDRSAVAAWLLAHGKITVPTGAAASVRPARIPRDRGRSHRPRRRGLA
ncbi:hypothetical protein ACFXB4_35825 [Streptomyces lavendulae]|uniref:hypothetical protein n=1 Tax=Streptomyces lavendulae TaxID=1914 RepID=UPI0036BD62BD